MDVSNKIVMEETVVSETTLIDWNNFIRDVCFEYMTNHMVPIGGLDDNGEPHVVEVDESVFFKTKYNVGQRCELHWLIGGIQRGDHTHVITSAPKSIVNIVFRKKSFFRVNLRRALFWYVTLLPSSSSTTIVSFFSW